MAKPRKRIAAIPPVPKTADRGMAAFLNGIKEALDVRLGNRGDAGEQAVTFNDLVEGKLAKGYKVVNGYPIVDKIPFGEPEDDPALPPVKPLEFKAVGVFQGIHLLWDAPIGYSSTSFTEVWRSEEPDLETAVQLGGTAGRSYFDILVGQDDETYYYWIRHTNDAGRKGAWSDMVKATKIGDVGYQLDVLTGQINETQLDKALNSRIDLIDGPATLKGSVAARVASEEEERVTGDSALGRRINQTSARVDDVSATVTSESKARANADEALSTQITQVSATLGDKVSTVEQNFESRADKITNTLNSIYTLRIDNDGYVAGFGLSNDGNTSSFIVRADTFAVGGVDDIRFPFIIQDGVSYLDTTMIRRASIQEGQLGPISFGKIVKSNGTPVTTVGGLLRADSVDANNLSVASAARFSGDVYSDNYRSGVRGWCILQSGYVEFNEAMIRGNLEVQSISVNGNAAVGGIQGSTSNYSRDYSGDDSGSFTRSASTSVSEMPQNSSLDLTLYSRIRVEALLGGGNWVSPRGQSQSYSGGGSVRVSVRTRMWVDGSIVFDQSQTIMDWNFKHSGSQGSPTHYATRTAGSSWDTKKIRHTYDSYKSSSRVQMDHAISVSTSISGVSPRAEASVYVDGQMFSGNLNRLG